MPRQNRDDREEEIEAIAYRLLEARGYSGVGMQDIAQAARASNETLYRWYGDKAGLFRALIARNADQLGTALTQAAERGERGIAVLHAVGPLLLTMLLSERAVALNRAAAADPSGDLGCALADAGRNACTPKLVQVITDAQAGGELATRRDGREVTPHELTELWLTLLIGDLQVRRVTGALAPPTKDEIGQRSQRALEYLARLYPPDIPA